MLGEFGRRQQHSPPSSTGGQVSEAMPSRLPAASRHYDANYGNFQTDLYAQIRRDAFGEDIGQSSWLTADEQDKFLGWLNLSSGQTLLDIACESGGPVLRIAERTGCSVVGVDVHEQAITTVKSLAAQRSLSERAKFQAADALRHCPFPTPASTQSPASTPSITCPTDRASLRIGRAW